MLICLLNKYISSEYEEVPIGTWNVTDGDLTDIPIPKLVPVHIATTDQDGSGKIIKIMFKRNGEHLSGLTFVFDSPPTYKIDHCSTTNEFPILLPQDTVRIFTIRKTRTGFNIECNGREVLQYALNETDCDQNIEWDLGFDAVSFDDDDDSSTIYSSSYFYKINGL